MQYAMEVYDEQGKCKVCGSHISELHDDMCEVGALRRELKKCESEIRRLRNVIVQLSIDIANAMKPN